MYGLFFMPLQPVGTGIDEKMNFINSLFLKVIMLHINTETDVTCTSNAGG